MIVSRRGIKLTACLALCLVAFWSLSDAVPRGLPSRGQEAQAGIEEGKKLYENGDYEEAIRTLLEALKRTKSNAVTVDARLYLALSYYALGKADDSRAQLEALFRLQPGRPIDESLYAEGFVDLYETVQAEKRGAAATGAATPRVAVRAAPKSGGGKKFPWLAVGGAAVAVGVGVALLLGKKDTTTPSLPTTGSIIVHSNPGGAKVFLDGADTGVRSNCTLPNVSPGSHSLRLDLENYGRWEGQVSVLAGQTTQVDAALGPFLYDFVSAWGTGGAGNGEFQAPVGICVNSTEAVYVVDSGNHRVERFSPLGGFQQKWGSFGSTNGKFFMPNGIAFMSGSVIVADSENNRIQMFGAGGTFSAKWGSQGTNPGQFRTPMGVAGGSGRIYVADTLNNRIQVFDEDGLYLSGWGGGGAGDGQFNHPVGIAVDKDGFVYVADKLNHRVQKFRSDGSFVLKYGSQGGGDGQFIEPWGVATDRYGYVFVADTGNNRIQKWTPGGAFMIRWGQSGADVRSFNQPKGIVCDGSDNVYVVDTGNNRVQKFRISVQLAGGSAAIRMSGPRPPLSGLMPGRPLGGPPRGVAPRPSVRRGKSRD